MRFDVSCVGLTILDILGRPIERIPPGGNVEFIDEIRLTVAGTAAGTVIDCAKLGLQARAVGAVGQDEKGDFVVDTYRRHGIDVEAMQHVSGVPTSATILNIRPNGDRPALHVRGASDHLRLEDKDYAAACDAKYLHMGGSGLLRTLDGDPTVALLKAAKARGCVTTFDIIAPSDDTMGIVGPCLPYVDYFMPSMEEAAFLSGKTDPLEISRFFFDQGASICVFKWGDKGSYLATPDEQIRIPAYRVNVVDTTGCGDAYCAGFIAGLARGWDLEMACRMGTAASGLVATGLGSDAGIVDFDRTADLIKTAEILT